MGLHYLTEKQEKVFEESYEYTAGDVLELSCLACSIEALVHCLIDSDDQKDQDMELSIYAILKTLIKPIKRFLENDAEIIKLETRQKGKET